MTLIDSIKNILKNRPDIFSFFLHFPTRKPFFGAETNRLSTLARANTEEDALT